jgi:hypothetical protein
MDTSFPIISCDSISIEGPCPTATMTPSQTSTQTPTSTIGSTPTQTPSNTATQTQTPTLTPSVTPTSTPFGDCNRLYVDFNIGSGYVDEYFSFSSTLSPGFINLIPLSGFSLTCSTYNSQSYAVYTGETTGKALIYNSQNNQFVIWDNLTSPQCGSLTGSLIISASWSTGFTDNGFIHPLNGASNNGLANLNYVGTCNAAPTPTITKTPTTTPTQTMTPSPSPGYCCDLLYFSGKTASYSAFTGTYSIQSMSGNYIGYIDDLGGYTSKCIAQNGINYTIWKNTNNQLIAFSEGNGKFILLPNSFVTFTTCNTYFVNLIGNVELTSGYTEDCFSLALPITADTIDYSLSYVNCHLAPTPTPSVTASQTATQTVTPTPSTTIGATPSNTQTQTVTPTNTNTPSMTQTNTPTPSVTLTATTAGIDITNGSLDIQISSVYVNSVVTTVIGGSLPNTTGNGTNLETNQLGTYTVEVNYSCSVAGQKITLTDSDLFSTCQNTNTGSNTLTFTSVVVAAYHNVTIDAQDGTC